ncbi:hypothetical protein GGQ74_002717 [Desulfobaculum xiamenense]|uniref:Lipoprotein n=1 Tax=Desulfobaculum xiamenense TaxID=995050 RepID=A0A846QRN1_9BACT|nr:GNA1162 family protein [Desulfobaculum xiamenense]NJB69023.1 hypothetical protein [Desulfobaculum xiamenense]
MLIRKHTLALVVLATLVLQGCATGPQFVTKQERFPLMYEEEPLSILVLPPMNQSTAADAKDYYSTTIQEPLSLLGYYTYPVPVTNEILKMEGVYDTEMLYGLPLEKFREYFGADAVLYTTITQWDTAYFVLGSNLTVAFTAEIKSTKTNRTIWDYSGTIVVDLSGGNSGGSPLGLVVQIVATAVKTAVADYVPYARTVNTCVFSALPVGKYRAEHMQDQQALVLPKGQSAQIYLQQ